MIDNIIDCYKAQEIGSGDEQNIGKGQKYHGAKKLVPMAHLEDRVDGDGRGDGADQGDLIFAEEVADEKCQQKRKYQAHLWTYKK